MINIRGMVKDPIARPLEIKMKTTKSTTNASGLLLQHYIFMFLITPTLVWALFSIHNQCLMGDAKSLN